MSAPERPVTIRALAAKCGVSIATISLALRNHPRISRETRERIQQIAREAGYRPNPMMAAHWETVRARKAASFQSVIAVITDWETAPRLTKDPWLSPAFEAMAHRADALGYKIEEFSIADADPERRAAKLISLLRVLHSRGILCILIFFPAHPGMYSAHAARLEDFAVAFICSEYQHKERTMSQLRHVPFHRTNPDTYGNMLQLLDKLRELGYRRPGFWPSSWIEALHAGESTAAFNFWIQSLPKKDRLTVDWTRWQVDPPLEKSHADFLKWFPTKNPDVVICQKIEVRDWIRELGLRIPHDVGLVHTHLGPPEKGWSGIDARYPAIAAAGVDLLTSHLHRNERGLPDTTKDVRIEGLWVQGKTTRVLSSNRPSKNGSFPLESGRRCEQVRTGDFPRFAANGRSRGEFFLGR